MSSHVTPPREGHVEAAIHVMAHVGQRYHSRLVYDPSYLEIDHNAFKKCDWSKFYRDAKVAIPMNTPVACLWISIMQGTKCLADQEVVF